MSDLGTALRELAREPASETVDPTALWRQGRRRVRRRRLAAGGLVVGLALLAGLGGLLVPAPSVVMPAGSGHGPAVPQNVFTPSRWLAGTSSAGPIGPLAVVGGMGRNGGNGLFGISASTGVYRALDLPGRADDEGQVALSPDGRHLAYWVTGPTSGTPYLAEGVQHVTGGFAVYDTVSGAVDRHLVDSVHGVGGTGLGWLDDDTLVVEYGQQVSTTGIHAIRSYVWRVGTPDAVPHDFRTGEPTEVMRNRDGTLLSRAGADGRFAQLRTVGDARVVAKAGPDLVLPAGSYVTVSRSGDHVLAVLYPDQALSKDNPLVIGTVGAGERVTALRTLPRPSYVTPVSLLGWIDRDNALVLANATGGDRYASLYAVNALSGSVRRLGTAEGAQWAPGIMIAPELLSSPMVHGNKPPKIDPRWHRVDLAIGVLVVGLIGVLVIGRLRRRRG